MVVDKLLVVPVLVPLGLLNVLVLLAVGQGAPLGRQLLAQVYEGCLLLQSCSIVEFRNCHFTPGC